MKKIWPWLLLLLLLIIFCVWSKKDSMHISSTTHTATGIASTMPVTKQYIDYGITQKGKNYVLHGNFKNIAQQNSLRDTCRAVAKQLSIKGTSTNDTLLDNGAINLTNKILPHFVKNYSNGKITYHNQKLTIQGNVEEYEAKSEMQRLLHNSTIPTQDNTQVLLVDPINYTILKDPKMLNFSGTLKNKKQVRALTKYLRPTYTTSHLQYNPHRIDKGSLPLTEKILPTFIKEYTHGKIQYTHETLIVEGTVQTQEALDKMSSLLANATIPVENFTILDASVVQQAQAQRDAHAKALASQKAQEQVRIEAEKRARAEAEAQKIRQEQVRLTKLKAKERSKVVHVIPKPVQTTIKSAKENIAKLLRIENIEFEVAKGSLTARGKGTVNKLANILSQYPHIKVEIAGHTDSDGSAQFNQRLSQSRVDTVRKRLITKGIPAARLTAKGYGESKPLVPNTSDANKQKNRRVEINIQGE